MSTTTRRARAGGWATPQGAVSITDAGEYGNPNVFAAFRAVTASINTSVGTVYVPPTGFRFRLMGYTVSVSSTAQGTFRAAGVASAGYQFNLPAIPAATPWSDDLRTGYPIPSVNQALVLDSNLAGAIFTGTVWGTLEKELP